jgi:tetratricopeptide (TPR) repeat protein
MALVQWVLGGKGKLGHVQQAIPLLDAAVAHNPHDWEAWEKKARALLLTGRTAEALSAAQTLISKAPRREIPLAVAATAAQKLGKSDLATTYWKEAVAVNPWMAFYRANLVTLLASAKAWDEAGPHCRAWLKLDPGNTDARKIWAEYLLHQAERPENGKNGVQ